MNKKDLKKEKICLCLLLFIAFCFCFCFFSRIHPLVVLDTDDWTYISEIRKAFPSPFAWNPTRILPETLMPLFSQIGVILFLPITNNYIFSLTIIHSIVVSTFIVIYLYCFIKLIKAKFNIGNFETICITILFFMLHFLILKNNITNNRYLFYAPDLTCYYFYIIPSLINLSLVMYFIADNTFDKKNSKLKTSILILAVYLAIFSNLFQSIILATYILGLLLLKFIKLDNKTKPKSIGAFIKNNILQIICLVLWLIAQIFEAKGGRANSLSSSQSFANNFLESFKQLMHMLLSLNRLFLLMFGILFIFLVVEIIIKKYYKKDEFKILLISSILTTIYLMLLTSACGLEYISRSDAMYAILFYMLFVLCTSVILVMKRFKFTVYLIPLLLFILVFFINTSSKTFAESNYFGMPYNDVVKIDNILINQIKEVADNNEKGIIYIPEFGEEGNWPLPKEGIIKVENALYKHGIIKNIVDIDVEYDGNLNEYLEKYKTIQEYISEN